MKRVALPLLVTALALIVAGIAMLSIPLAFISSGLALLGVVTFDPTRAGRLTWPR